MDESHRSEWELNYQPAMPRDRSKGIGIVGAGEIVRAAHLPAYRLANFNVVGIYDRDRNRARQVAADFNIPHTFSTLDDLVNCSDIEIVDIAVPSDQLRRIVEAVVQRRKHVLCQKPLAHSYDEARRIDDVCSRESVKAAVNQQMRWAPGIQASHDIIGRGWLGQLTQMTIQVNVLTPWDHWPWMTAIKGMEFLYHSIHYLDAIRYLAGEPDYIFADAAKFPGQPWPAETRTTIVMRFAGELRGLVQDNHNNFAPDNDWYATFRFEGTDGIIKGTNGALYDYPVGRGDTLSFLTKKIRQDTWITPELKGRWFPHAFMGSMGELMRAIEEDREPVNSVRDNLKTLKMVFAAMRSIDEVRPVWLSEIE
ncbi:MAG: gfo/Idh/MocA family oxidoreductase [Sulfobacillus acidophilus]|uniref:Gfo/Idh/MocA family oxidoreductase n=1 Tax=Sulfobacillus acidophilus TaxID=53633 RepID=A0A2T2WF74_9FIRM|nr:MAG: gfo/Idh/MocA family oxidoreductase [Sulfobacillus acidophilus]